MARSRRQLWTAKLTGEPVGGRAPMPAVTAGKRFKGRILGIDPSLRGTGLAVVDYDTPENCKLLFSQTLKQPTKVPAPDCLARIAESVQALCKEWKPDVAAIEETIYVQNFQTAQTMGATRGAAIAMVRMEMIPLFEYAPLRIKQAVVGHGRASKEQVGAMVRKLCKLEETLPSDESDAAAIALCHAMTYRSD